MTTQPLHEKVWATFLAEPKVRSAINTGHANEIELLQPIVKQLIAELDEKNMLGETWNANTYLQVAETTGRIVTEQLKESTAELLREIYSMIKAQLEDLMKATADLDAFWLEMRRQALTTGRFSDEFTVEDFQAGFMAQRFNFDPDIWKPYLAGTLTVRDFLLHRPAMLVMPPGE
jgi:hypothetical protein